MKLKSLLEQTQYRSFDDGVRGELGFSKEQYPNDYDRNIARLEKIRNIKNNPEKYGFAAWDGSDTQQGSLSKLQGMEAATMKSLEKQFPKKFKAYSDLNRNKRIASGEQLVMSPAHLAKISGMNPEQATAAANRIGLSYSKYYDSLSDDERSGAKKKWVPFKVEDEFPDYKPKKSTHLHTTESKNIKNSRKQLIEKYINHRIQRLQKEATSGVTDKQLAEWEWPSWDKVKQVGGKIYDTSANVLSAAGNIPIIGKVPGMIGGGMQLAKGAYTGDKEMMLKGGANMAFSGVPGAGVVGKQIAKQGAKQIAKHGGGKLASKIGGDMAKIGTKTAVKTPIGQDFSNTPKGGVPTQAPAPNYSIKQGVPNYA